MIVTILKIGGRSLKKYSAFTFLLLIIFLSSTFFYNSDSKLGYQQDHPNIIEDIKQEHLLLNSYQEEKSKYFFHTLILSILVTAIHTLIHLYISIPIKRLLFLIPVFFQANYVINLFDFKHSN